MIHPASTLHREPEVVRHPRVPIVVNQLLAGAMRAALVSRLCTSTARDAEQIDRGLLGNTREQTGKITIRMQHDRPLAFLTRLIGDSGLSEPDRLAARGILRAPIPPFAASGEDGGGGAP